MPNLNSFSLTFNDELPLSSRLADIHIIPISGGAELNTQFDGEQLVLSRVNGEMQYSITFTQTGEYKGSFASEPITLGPNERHTAKLTSWNNWDSTLLVIEIDKGMDGTIDEAITLGLQNQPLYLPFMSR